MIAALGHTCAPPRACGQPTQVTTRRALSTWDREAWIRPPGATAPCANAQEPAVPACVRVAASRQLLPWRPPPPHTGGRRDRSSERCAAVKSQTSYDGEEAEDEVLPEQDQGCARGEGRLLTVKTGHVIRRCRRESPAARWGVRPSSLTRVVPLTAPSLSPAPLGRRPAPPIRLSQGHHASASRGRRTPSPPPALSHDDDAVAHLMIRSSEEIIRSPPRRRRAVHHPWTSAWRRCRCRGSARPGQIFG